jgi:solute carrier family 25 phosphate transporter 23/24/25/41
MSSSKPTSAPLVPDPLPNPNSIANMSAPQSPPTSASSSVKSPIEPTPFYGLRSWISQVVVASFIAGGTAGAVSRTVVSPLERLKILLQVQNVGREEYKMSIGKALGKMWREEGWRGMMAGNGANCMRIVPYSAVQFGSYNIYKKVCPTFFLLR